MINTTKCMARLKRDPKSQCRNNKKCGEFCKIHENTPIIGRIDWEQKIDDIESVERLTTKQLKQTAEKYNLEWKTKKELLENVKNHINGKKDYNGKVLVIQKAFRNYIKNKCVNDEDFLTFTKLTDIPNHLFFCYKDDNHFYGFHISSIYEVIKNESINPYNRKTIPDNVVENIKKMYNKNNTEDFTSESSKINTFQRIINIFKKIDDLGYYTQVQWFNNLNIIQLKNYYAQAEDIWNYRAYELTKEVKKNIVAPDGICFNRLLKIQLTKDIDSVRNICLDEIEKMITKGKDISDRKMGAMYVLSALVIVSYDAACSLPWLLDSVM